MTILAAPHPSDVEFHHPEPFGSTSDVGFGHQNIGVGFRLQIWPPQDHGFGCPKSPRALDLDAQNAVGRWQMLALAIRTLTLALDGGFGHPTSLRPSSDVEFCHPEPLESTLVCGSGCYPQIVEFGQPTSTMAPSDLEFGTQSPLGQRWMLALAVGTLGDDFGCPTSIRR